MSLFANSSNSSQGLNNGSNTNPTTSVSPMLAAGLIAGIALTGFCANAVACLCALLLKSLCYPFCRLYACLSAADACLLLVFLVWAAPTAASGYETGKTGFRRKVGLALMLAFFTSFFAQLSMAINRFVAVTRPSQYYRIYSANSLKLNITMTVLLGITASIPYAFNDCEFYFDPSASYVWHYSISPCGELLDKLCSAVCVIGLVLVALFNLATYWSLRRHVKQIEPISGGDSYTVSGGGCGGGAEGYDSAYAGRRKAREFSFFVQTIVNGSLYVLFAIAYHLLARFQPFPDWLKFVCKTLLWECAHGASGVVFLMLNSEAREVMAITASDLLRCCCCLWRCRCQCRFN